MVQACKDKKDSIKHRKNCIIYQEVKNSWFHYFVPFLVLWFPRVQCWSQLGQTLQTGVVRRSPDQPSFPRLPSWRGPPSPPQQMGLGCGLPDGPSLHRIQLGSRIRPPLGGGILPPPPTRQRGSARAAGWTIYPPSPARRRLVSHLPIDPRGLGQFIHRFVSLQLHQCPSVPGPPPGHP